MKKKIVVLLTGVMAVAMVLSGCSSKGLETDDLTISQYKGVEIEPVDEPDEITDEEIENGINQALLNNLISEGTIQEGDTAVIDYVGKIDGEEFDGGTSSYYPLEIGSDTFIDGFEDSIIGHTVGETFDWDGSFPDNYGNEEYAGQAVTFTITIEGILPEYNDEFVQRVSDESETVDEYREEMKAQLEEQAQQDYEDAVTAAVWNQVLNNTEVKQYPEDEIQENVDMILDQYKSWAESYEVEYEEFIEQQMGSSVEDFEADIEETIRSSEKQTMVIQAIADKEKIEPTEEEYETEYEKLAEEYGYDDVDTFKSVGGEEDLKEVALGRIVKAWLVENSVQKEAE